MHWKSFVTLAIISANNFIHCYWRSTQVFEWKSLKQSNSQRPPRHSVSKKKATSALVINQLVEDHLLVASEMESQVTYNMPTEGGLNFRSRNIHGTLRSRILWTCSYRLLILKTNSVKKKEFLKAGYTFFAKTDIFDSKRKGNCRLIEIGHNHFKIIFIWINELRSKFYYWNMGQLISSRIHVHNVRVTINAVTVIHKRFKLNWGSNALNTLKFTIISTVEDSSFWYRLRMRSWWRNA